MRRDSQVLADRDHKTCVYCTKNQEKKGRTIGNFANVDFRYCRRILCSVTAFAQRPGRLWVWNDFDFLSLERCKDCFYTLSAFTWKEMKDSSNSDCTKWKTGLHVFKSSSLKAHHHLDAREEFCKGCWRWVYCFTTRVLLVYFNQELLDKFWTIYKFSLL